MPPITPDSQVCGNCANWQILPIHDDPKFQIEQDVTGVLLGDCMVTLPMFIMEETDNGVYRGQDASGCNCFRGKSAPLEVWDDDIKLMKDHLWVEAKKKHSICIHETDEGVVVDMYALGHEDEDAINTTYQFDSEVEDAEE